MKTISKEKFRKQIIEYFIEASKITIKEAKIKIKEQIKEDEYNNDITAGNVRLFYTSNENFCNGKKNGYGIGWYITNKSFGGGGMVKI